MPEQLPLVEQQKKKKKERKKEKRKVPLKGAIHTLKQSIIDPIRPHCPYSSA